TDNCEISFESQENKIFIPQNSLVFIERGAEYTCCVKKFIDKSPPCKIIRLDTESLQILKNIMASIFDYKLDENTLSRKMDDKIISVKSCKESELLFQRIYSIGDKRKIALKIAYLISRTNKAVEIFHSLVVSSAHSFSDKVRAIIHDDLSRKWRLSFIAEIFNISEVTVRKRLESEGVCFNNLLLTIRMNEAMKMLLDNEKQINQISSCIGIHSTSYFIKQFKEFYGVTPKQYKIYFRN
ncbi:TPA: helix-turn-helix transcriptional regulator, partial [Escherichia coli]|nr:helix-turn-helix transcriptional regulator [Escherichia coli]